MIITQNREKLNEAIKKEQEGGDPRWIVLLLSGAKGEGSTAGRIHDFLESVGLEPWRKYFLITDLTVLTASERQAWFEGANLDRYAVLERKTKKVVATAKASELLRVDGQPSITKIQRAFNKGAGDTQ